jgi:hypothetical protein
MEHWSRIEVISRTQIRGYESGRLLQSESVLMTCARMRCTLCKSSKFFLGVIGRLTAEVSLQSRKQ